MKSHALARLRRLLVDRLHPPAEPRSDGPLRLTRRDVVAVAAIGAATVASKRGSGTDGGGDTIVVGAGIAGLHCAWRLVEQGVPVTVVDAQNRVGGRMYTGRNLFASGHLCELGGELIDSNHATMWALAHEFGIAIDDRQANEPPGLARDTWFVGGRAVPEAEVAAQFTAVAQAIAGAFTRAEASDGAFALLDGTTLADFLATAVPAATYPELHAILTSAYRGEFGLETDAQSCLNLVYLIDAVVPDPFRIFGDSDERWHTHDGNDVFCTALADAIGRDKIQLETKVVGVYDGPGQGFAVELEGAGGIRRREAFEHVVFALPFTKLREIPVDVRRYRKKKQRAVDTLGYGHNAKVMGGFTARPWLEVHNASGSVTTDLPFQQTWDTTVGQAGPGGVLTNFLGGDQGDASASGTDVDWFAGILPGLETVFPGVTEAWDGTAVRFHWPTHPWTLGSYACYLPGQWSLYGTEGRRIGNLHFCGEHCSLDFQGWMEGAAETGALVAAEILDDLGLGRSESHASIVELKTLVPQACYHGDLLPDTIRPLARRRALARVLNARARDVLGSSAS